MLSRHEQETHIYFNREDKTMEIYTADPVWMNKLDKLCETSDMYEHDPNYDDDVIDAG